MSFEAHTTYDPITTIERIAASINEVFPDKAVGLLVAATELESRHRCPKCEGEPIDRRVLSDHWGVTVGEVTRWAEHD